MFHVERSQGINLTDLPELPGVYVFKDGLGEVIYVGKAKQLKRRVSSYFIKQNTNAKTKVLVKQIESLEFFVVNTEFDALLLENNLIKKHQPKYNILLKDDKTYPWIVLKREVFPRVFTTRKRIKDGSQYFGPYSSVRTARTLVQLLHEMYQLRTCSLDLSAEKIGTKNYKVCLEYHLKRCKAPCVGQQNVMDYNASIAMVTRVLKGDVSSVLDELKQRMYEFSENLQFEEAALAKHKYDLLQDFYSKSVVVNPNIGTVDVFFAFDDADTCYLNYLHVRDGAIAHLYNLEVKRRMDEPIEELLPSLILDIREQYGSNAKDVIVPFELEFMPQDLTLHIPQRGDKRKLLDLSEKNARMYKLEKLKQMARLDPERHVERVLEQMKKDLHLTTWPKHIECFDNSNIQGTNPVAACVVFKDTRPSKADYRHYNVKTVVGPDDFASMREIVFRRYRRLLDEGESLPQLVVIDGGKGQLSAAVESLTDLGLFGKIAVVGIAKRLEEIYFPNDSVPLYLDKSSETLKIIQHLRNEAHRFGITFHRKKRSANFIQHELTSLDGVGEKTVLSLYKKFKTMEAIKSASFDELADLIGTKRAQMVIDYLNASKS